MESNNKETEKKSFEFKRRHIVYIIIGTVVVSVVGALIINLLYSLGKNGNAIHTEWQASDTLLFFATVLEALGTISLGAISIWQNVQLQKSNEESQARLEKISIQANEVIIISQIVECERSRLRNIEALCEDFINMCLADKIIKDLENGKELVPSTNNSVISLATQYMQLSREIENGFFFGKEKVELLCSINDLFDAATDFYSEIKEGKLVFNEEITKRVGTCMSEVKACKEKYLGASNENIISIILGEVTLEKVKEFHYKEQEKTNKE